MIKHLKLCLLIVPLLSIAACSHHQERKAPCPQTAGISTNPCNPLPINVAELHIQSHKGEV